MQLTINTEDAEREARYDAARLVRADYMAAIDARMMQGRFHPDSQLAAKVTNYTAQWMAPIIDKLREQYREAFEAELRRLALEGVS